MVMNNKEKIIDAALMPDILQDLRQAGGNIS
jgi:hypothetical protein